jgi:sortase A
MKLRIVVPPNRTRKVVRLLLLLVGVTCLSIFSYSYLYRTAYQLYEGWQFDHEESAPLSQAHPTALPVVLPDPDRAAPRTARSLPAGVIGRISIPRLHISAMVEEGVDDVTLFRAVGHIPGTALPGETGNIGIAGHRDTFFRSLKDLKPEDRIDVTTHSGSFHYTVDSLSVVEPTDINVLKSSAGQTLTIVTCFPFNYIGNAPRRFIVHAVATY